MMMQEKKLGQCEINTVSGRHLSAMYDYGLLVCLLFFLRPYRLNIFFDVDDQVRISSGAVCVHADISSSPLALYFLSVYLLVVCSLDATEINDCSRNAIEHYKNSWSADADDTAACKCNISCWQF